ncbi:MAG: helix-turn-helix domain-containing protein [Psychroserpens sp.]|nr:helix-turn-helix domain-containing protein [Psychroserpens sp.]
MSETSSSNGFLEQAKGLVLDQISNENFGVSELATAMHMSRSSLLRKIKKQTGLSASQYIRNVRLEKAREILKESEQTVSEISFEVGFSNPSYFIKCYREYFGHPPGEARKIFLEDSKNQLDLEFPDAEVRKVPKSFFQLHLNKIIVAVTIIVIAVISFYWGSKDAVDTNETFEKSIAVLPFKNMSADSTNYYFVNGLMEASLYNLQKIGDLRVVSRTSVEKYRDGGETASKIAEELKVTYLVEGSGQKINDEILLNIQLIDTRIDSPIWTERYQYKLEDVFTLQNTIAKQIALAVEANITPEELAQIDKTPTENLEAYDLYLKGLEQIWKKDEESLKRAIHNFQQAVEKDPEFANAYGQLAIAYYFMDEYKPEKPNLENLNKNADQALLYDSRSDISLVAKALYYIANKEFKLAIPHLEKALEYNPNSSMVILILSEMYARVLPDTKKYLTYALKGAKLERNPNDSIAQSYLYLHLSNALVQAGFVEESLTYINKSIAYFPGNPYPPYLKGFITYAKDKDMDGLISTLKTEWQKDTTRVDITQEIGKMYYFKEDYETSFLYYQKFKALQANTIDLYPYENLKIGIVYDKMGYPEKTQEFFQAYKEHCNNDKSIYQPASLAMQYIYDGKLDEAITQFQKFSNGTNFQYWMILFMEDDPLLKELRSHKDYEPTMQEIRDQFWENHNEIKTVLQENDLI